MVMGVSGPGGYERQLAALGVPRPAAQVAPPRVGDPPPVAPADAGYTGLGIFPWETPAGVGFRAPWTPQNGGGTVLPAGIPAAIPAGLAAVGLGGLAAGLGGLYGVSQAIGVQYPWETGPGEGFIAPWNRDIKQDESGLWVTRATRPDLFNGAPGTAMVPAGTTAMVAGAAALGAGGFRKTWLANGWPFAMTMDADGKHKRIHTIKKDGSPVSWRPYRSIVIGKTLTFATARRAMRRLKGQKKLADEIEKLGGTRTVYRKK